MCGPIKCLSVHCPFIKNQDRTTIVISIIKELETRAQKHPEKLLYSFLDIKGLTKQSYTYQEFLGRVDSIASHLYSTQILKPSDRALLVYPPGLEMICTFFACIKLGTIPVPVYPPSSKGFLSLIHI